MTRSERIEKAARALLEFIEERPAVTPDTPLGWRAADLRAAIATEDAPPTGWWNGEECQECGRVFAAVNATGRDRCPACGWTNAQQDAFERRLMGESRSDALRKGDDR